MNAVHEKSETEPLKEMLQGGMVVVDIGVTAGIAP